MTFTTGKNKKWTNQFWIERGKFSSDWINAKPTSVWEHRHWKAMESNSGEITILHWPESCGYKRGWFPYKNHDSQGSGEQGSVVMKFTQATWRYKPGLNASGISKLLPDRRHLPLWSHQHSESCRFPQDPRTFRKNTSMATPKIQTIQRS